MMQPFTSAGERFRQSMKGGILPLIGVYDVFSAGLAARHFEGVFLSGFGFAASYYGLPDLGFIAWSDMVSYVERVRSVLPETHLLVDIDDGYGDPEVAAEVVCRLERCGASGIMLEDQLRPRKCGHYEGKQIMELPQYLKKLNRVMNARSDLCVLARTDAQEPGEVIQRVRAFADAGADMVMAEAVRDLDTLRRLRDHVSIPIVCNQIAGGKTPAWSLTEMSDAGVGVVLYSTPTLFAAQQAIVESMIRLKANDGRLETGDNVITLKDCTGILSANHQRSWFREAG